MKQEQKDNNIAWSLYWAEDRLHSCVATDDEADQKILNQLWASFSDKLPDAAQVMDLATGNGAVPAALLAAKPSLKIAAVDLADIQPQTFLKNRPELQDVEFRGAVDVSKPVLAERRFDAITSQFGIEYAGLIQAASANLPQLNDGAPFQFLVHHHQSEIVKSSSKKLIELNELLKPNGVLATMIEVLKGQQPFSSLEEKGRAFLAEGAVRTESITGQVFRGIEQMAAALATDLQGAQKLGATLNLRVSSEQERLQQMLNAAQNAEQLEEFNNSITAIGMTVDHQSEVYVDADKKEYLLGWLIQGHKA